jgi:hypothetical protein
VSLQKQGRKHPPPNNGMRGFLGRLIGERESVFTSERAVAGGYGVDQHSE